MDKLQLFRSAQSAESKLKDLKTGWTVKIHQKIKEGEKTRVQAFEGTIIARKHGNDSGGTITVRKVSGGVGVEKTFPVYLPSITKVEVFKRTGAGKAKLYYQRDKSALEIKRKTRREASA